jgi:hypothetical protein
MLDNEISSAEYKDIKVSIEEELSKLNLELHSLKITNEHSSKIQSCSTMLKNIDVFYEKGNIETKQKIIGSIFPEKLIFENNKYRTARINEVVELICRKDEESQGPKKRKHFISEVLSCSVVPPGIEPLLIFRQFIL